MASRILRSLQRLEIEEKILNIASLVAVIGVFMPWFGGEWFGEPTVWSGLGFYTSFVGLLIVLGNIYILALTILPLFGHQILRASRKEIVRLIIGLESVLLVVVVWSILTNISFDRAQMEIRFGVYLTFMGSIVVSLYSFLRVQQQRKRAVKELFHHPEEVVKKREAPDAIAEETPPPPPPPPPGEPEKPKLL